jgi:hypothetical protein
VTVWDGKGQLIAHAANERPLSFHEAPSSVRPGVSVIRGRRGSRELFVRGAFESTVMVQRSIEETVH